MVKRAFWVIFLLFWCFVANGKPSVAGQSDSTSAKRNPAEAGQNNGTATENTVDQSENDSAKGNASAAGQSDGASANGFNTYSSIAPPFLTPGKELFVTREGDQFVLTVTCTCLIEDDSESQFELVSPTPQFIHVSESYRREVRVNGYTEGIGVIYVTPQPGDAGKYVVKLQVKACNGRVERTISFRVHVKAAF
jgi:hypothetical protein